MAADTPSDLTPAELTLLGLLVEEPRHGYELDEVISARGMREWTEIGFSSIYYLLARLRDRGLITEVEAPRGGRGKARRVYGPTPEGRRACALAAEAAVAELRPVFPPVLVGLANQPVIPPERLRAALDRRAEALAERTAAIEAARDATPGMPAFVRAIFDHTLGQLAAERQWLSDYRAAEAGGRSPKTLPGRRTAMTRYDVKRELKRCYAPRNTDWELVDVPPQRFIAVDGHGDPNTSPAYARAIEALYAVAYTIKFSSKAAGRDFVVGPLEGLWWADDPRVFITREKDAWHWRMLISRPDWITDDLVEEAKWAALAKKNRPAIVEVHAEALEEGTCAQLLHFGPYDDEAPALARLHDEYLAANDLRMSGHHHEIYLGDHRRTEPAKFKTVLRQPVRPRT
ncbi:hypothetical protein GWI34_06665 [Actinomadura sp. DSM 109109]|nr:hypothetical protein [Actinomadura lepetitiana]